MADIPLEVEALQRFYHNQIGIDETRALMAAYEDYETLQKGGRISPEALAAIPDPVRGGLASKVQFTNKGRQSFVIPPEEAYQNITPRTYANKKPGQDLAASINFYEGGQGTRVTHGLIVDGEGYVLGKYENKDEEEAPSNLGTSWKFQPGEVYPEEEPKRQIKRMVPGRSRSRRQHAQEVEEEEK